MEKKLNLLVFSGEYDKVLAALILANGAKDMGMDVTIFFAFWGLLVVREGNVEEHFEKNFFEKAFAMFTPKETEDLPLSYMNMGGMGQGMLKKMMQQSNKPLLKDFLEGAKKKEIKFYGCKLSIEVMGFKEKELIPELEIIEVNKYLEDALQSDIQLFI